MPQSFGPFDYEIHQTEIDSKIEEALDTLINQMCESESYKEYKEARRQVMYNMEARDAVIRTRAIREEIARMTEAERDSDYTERLVEEYDNLMDITAVHEFSLRELEFCNLYQEIMAKLAGSFELDVKR